MAISIGVMLTFQVFENYLLNWFTLEGYNSVITTYKDHSNSMGVNVILSFLLNYSKFIMPLQMALEPTLALLLILQVVRLTTSFATALLLLFLSYIEFGVPAKWPPTGPKDVTWLWELLFAGILGLLIFLNHLGKYWHPSNYLSRFMDEPVLHTCGLKFKLCWAIFIGIILSSFIMLTDEVSEHNTTLALARGLTAITRAIVSCLGIPLA